MRKPKRKLKLARRPALILLLFASVLLAGLLRHFFFAPHVTLLPFLYDPVQGSLRLRTDVAGQSHLLEFNSLLTKTALGRHIYQQLSQEERGLDRLSPSAEFALGSYHTLLFYEEVDEAALRPHTEGVLGVDLFAPSPGFEGRNRRQGARLTLDFKTNRLKLEDGPNLEPLHLPPGTLLAPLLRDGDGPYYLLLPLNNGASYRFALGIGSRDVLLPTGAVVFPAPNGTGYVDATGMVPITLTLGGQDLTVQAFAVPGTRTTGVLGMSLLSHYRVILDFRNRRLYLEPANSHTGP